MKKKDYWNPVSPEELTQFWKMPRDVAFNPNSKFYRSYTETDFELIAFLLAPENDTHFVFRFWSIHEYLFDSGWDIFEGKSPLHLLPLERKSIEDLILLVWQYAQDLVDIPEPQPIFQLIEEKDYPDYWIMPLSPEDSILDDILFYLHKTNDLRMPDMNSFLTFSGRAFSRLHVNTIQVSKLITDPDGFWEAVNESNGSLVLTKRGAEEFCELLRERLQYLK